MARNFHELYSEAELPLPSARSTGFVFAVVALIVALIFRRHFWVLMPALGAAGVFAATAQFAPRLLEPLNRAWFRFSILLSRVMNPVVMFVLFAVVIVPAGLLMRLFRDPLRSRRATERSSYWIERGPDHGSSSMRNQF
ncbi:MAG: hypothetical protein AB7E70_04025 [Hyphomicrobiaceae bacterium]